MPAHLSSQRIPYLLVEAVQTTGGNKIESPDNFPPAVLPHQRSSLSATEQVVDSHDTEPDTYSCPVYVRPMDEEPNTRGRGILQMDEVLNVRLACNHEHAPSYWTLLGISIVGT